MNTGYFLVDIERVPSNEANRWPSYSGIDRSPWRNVDEKYYADKLPNDLVVLRKQSFRSHIMGLSFGTLASIRDVEQFAKVCDASDARRLQILTVEFLGSVFEAEMTLGDASCGLGLDAYVDGYGSILNLGFVQRPELFEMFLGKLNKYGLFNSIQDIQQYAVHYKEIATTANLEVIEDLAAVLVYHVTDIHDVASVPRI